jgi:drug/metabolite transporter (DMT)-like permease
MQALQAKFMHYGWLILLSVSSGVAGQTAIKLGVSQPGAADATGSLVSLLLLIVRSPWVLLGLLLYALGALAWIAVLARLDLSIAYPFLALNFVLVTLVSRFFLGESVPALRWLGILVICAGIFLVARSTR